MSPWDVLLESPALPLTVLGTVAGLLVSIMGKVFSGFVERQSIRTRRLLTERVTNGDVTTITVDGRVYRPWRGPTEAKVDGGKPGTDGQSSDKAAPPHGAPSGPPQEIATPPESADSTLLREYYTQGISQSKVSFVASLVAACLGFLLILVACFGAIFPPPGADAALASTVTLVAGALVEAVAVLFFTQSNRARILMSDMHDRLRTDRKADREFDKAMILVDEVHTPALKDQLKVDVARHFIGLQGTNVEAADGNKASTEA